MERRVLLANRMAFDSLLRVQIALANLVDGASRLTTEATWAANDTPPMDVHKIASAAVNLRIDPKLREFRSSLLDSAPEKTCRT